MNNSRNTLRCNYCEDIFIDENDLASHQINHLVISVQFLNLCPFCDENIPKLCDCVDHVLEHFSSDKIEQCRLLRWLSNVIKKTDEQVNIPGKKQLHYYSTETRVYRLGDLTINLPKIMPYLKCFVCETFIDPDIIGEHALEHFSIKDSKRIHVLVWFSKFFESKQASMIEKRYDDYFEQFKTTNLSSNMLERLPMFETAKTNVCRYQNCGMSVSDSAELFSHYMEWHGWSQKQCWFCIVCNYNASNKQDLFDHFHSRHIACIFCKEKFPANFDACLSHVKKCLRWYCPYCKNRIANFKELIKHVNKGSSVPVCFYCKTNFDSARDLKRHLDICTKRPPPGVYCLSCRTSQFTDKDKFNQHMLECRPGYGSEVNPSCINGTIRSNSIRSDNLITYSEMKNCPPRIIDDISSKRYHFLLGKTCHESTVV